MICLLGEHALCVRKFIPLVLHLCKFQIHESRSFYSFNCFDGLLLQTLKSSNVFPVLWVSPVLALTSISKSLF